MKKSYKYLKDFLIENTKIEKESDILENVERYYPKDEEYSKKSLYYNPFYGKFPFKENQIRFFVIFHQANFTGRYKNKYNRSYYINRHLKFIKEKILTEVLQIK